MAVDQLIPAETALQIVLGNARPLKPVTLPLHQAANLVLAEDLVSKRTQPPFDASAMDGFAVRAADVETCPVTLNIIGESKAGTPFAEQVLAGEAVRIFTGAVVPQGADTIVIQENAKLVQNKVEIAAGAGLGKFIRKAGLDFKIGDKLLKKGDILTPKPPFSGCQYESRQRIRYPKN